MSCITGLKQSDFSGSGYNKINNAISIQTIQLMLGIATTAATTILLLSKYSNRQLIVNGEVDSHQKKKKRRKTVPYVSGIGLFETFREFSGIHCPLFVLRCAEQQRTVNNLDAFRLPLPVPGGLYIVNDYKLIRTILKDTVTDRSPLYKSLNAVAGTKESIFTSNNNAHWKMVRKLTSPAFASTEVKRMKDIVQNLTDNWCTAHENHDSVIVDKEMVNIAFRVICLAAFEYDVSDNELNEYSHHLDISLLEYLNKRVVNPFRATILGTLLYKEVREAEVSVKHLRKFGQHLLDSYRNNPDKLTDNVTLMNLLANSTSIENDKQRVAEILVYVGAGHETSGHTISNLFILLALNPHVLEKLRSDTQNLFPEEWANKSIYYQYCIKELHRYLPVAAMGSARLTGKEYLVTSTSIDSGTSTDSSNTIEYIIPKGANVMLSHITPGRNPFVYGTDYNTFNPDRWYNSTTEMNDSLIPFAIGNRNCIGQSLAVTELDTIIPTILSYYNGTIELLETGTLEYFVTWKYKNYKLKFNRNK